MPSFSRRDQALILLGLHSGFRARELGALTVSHVAREAGQIRDKIVLERRHLKNGRGVRRERICSRAIPLTASARLALDQYLQERRTEGSAHPEVPAAIVKAFFSGDFRLTFAPVSISLETSSKYSS